MSTPNVWTGSAPPRPWARAGLVALLGFSGGLAPAATIRAPAFACETGPYAVVLPRHYPSLHVIGKHKTTDLDRRPAGAVTLTTRRIEYIGMTAEVRISSAEPAAYRLLSLDVESRRWNIGPLSVGRNPWRTVNDSALEGAAPDGVHQLVGNRDHAVLTVRAGRVDAVSYRCEGAGAR